MSNVVKMIPGPNGDIPLPNNIDAEQELLGAILMRNEVYLQVATYLEPEDFYEPLHQQVYEVISHQISSGRIATPITMAGLIGEIDGLGMSAGAYLAQLCAHAASAREAVEYGKTIKELSAMRSVYLLCERVRGEILAKGNRETPAALIDRVESELSSLRPSAKGNAGQFQSFAEGADRAVYLAQAALQKGGVLSGLSTGLTKLDDQLGGLQRSDLIIIAGRPGSGKTSLATNIALNVALDLRERRLEGEKTGVVGFFSLEMSHDQLATRILAETSKVSGWRVRKGQIRDAELEEFALAGERLRNLPLHTDATGNIPLASLLMRARNLHKKVGLDLVVVDYLQLIKAQQRGRESNRVQEVTEITGALKALAKELDCPVIALAQLSRRVEERDDKRPMLSDLRESGSIEQDADSVIFVYRDAYYLAKKEPPAGTERHNEWTMQMEKAHGRAELIIGKNRHGPESTVHVGFNANLTQFNNELPESILDNATPREKREAKKVRRFLKESGPALQDLRTLVLTSSLENDGHVDAAKNHKIVPYTLWKKKVAASLLDPEATEAQKVKLMKDVVADLKTDPPLIGRGGSESESFVWLIS